MTTDKAVLGANLYGCNKPRGLISEVARQRMVKTALLRLREARSTNRPLQGGQAELARRVQALQAVGFVLDVQTANDVARELAAAQLAPPAPRVSLLHMALKWVRGEVKA